MAATKYTYDISTDFPNQKEDTDRLTQEIDDDVTITTALDYISTVEEDCDIWFVDALSGAEIIALDAVVAAHSGDPLPIVADNYVKSWGETVTTALTWQTKASFSYTPQYEGDHLITYSALVSSSAAGALMKTRLTVDGIEEASSAFSTAMRLNYEDGYYQDVTRAIVVSLTAASIVALEFSSDGVGDSTYIKEALVTVLPMEG